MKQKINSSYQNIFFSLKTLVFTSLFLTYIFSPYLKAKETSGAWVGTFNKKNLDVNSFWWSEAQLRYNFNEGTTNQALYRTGYLNKISDRNELGFLFAYVQTGLIKEYRPTFQHSFLVSETDEYKVSLRNRLEFRHIEDQSEESLRFRTLLRFDKQTQSNDLSFVLWDEPFFHLQNTSWTTSQLIDRNRIFIGIKQSFKNYWMETGYLNQTVFLSNRKNQVEHQFAFYLFF